MADMIPVWKQKTFWASITGAIGAVAAYFTGEIGIVGAIGAVMAALTSIFMRQGIEKSKTLSQNLPPSERGETPQ